MKYKTNIHLFAVLCYIYSSANISRAKTSFTCVHNVTFIFVIVLVKRYEGHPIKNETFSIAQ